MEQKTADRVNDSIEEMVCTIAERLGDYDRVTEIMNAGENRRKGGAGEEEPWNAWTLSQGLPGVCLLYGKLMELFPGEEKWCTLAHAHLGRIVEGLNVQGVPGISMFSGLAGIGLCTVGVSGNFQNYRRLIHTVNNGITEQFDAYITYAVTPQGTHSLLYDVIGGISGVLSYLSLFCREDRCYVAVRQGLKTLVELSGDIRIRDVRVPGWYIPPENQFSETEQKIYPQGNFNTSFSHGIAGVLTILSQMLMQGIEVEGQRPAIEKIADFYFRFRCNDGKRDFWKGQIDFTEVAQGRLTEANIVRRDAWCYGSPGICYALIAAGCALDRQEWVQYGIQNIRQTMQDIRGIFSPTFCHGYAGLYQILNSVEALLGQELFPQELAALRRKLLDFYDPARAFGFADVEPDRTGGQMRAYDAVGLLDGAAGVCLALLEGEHPGKNVWKKAFLLA